VAAGATYSTIATTTLSSSASSVTFSSISGAYTDLVLVFNGGITTADYVIRIRFNGDSGSNYSRTAIAGVSNQALSDRASNATGINVFAGYSGIPANTLDTNGIAHIQNYSNSTTYKSVISRSGNANRSTEAQVGLWRSTSAITSIVIDTILGNIYAGSTFSLYGIAAA
jgi:hypothetical protein